MPGPIYADQLGGPKGVLDLLEFFDRRSYALHCESACRVRWSIKWARVGEVQLTQRS